MCAPFPAGFPCLIRADTQIRPYVMTGDFYAGVGRAGEIDGPVSAVGQPSETPAAVG